MFSMIITLFPAAAFSEPDEEITSFAPITLSAGTVSAAVYADAAAVIAALSAQYPSVTAATYSGGGVSVPVAGWTETDTYDPSTVGSYTFTATLGDIPAGYANPHNLTATAEVVVGGSGGTLADGKYNIKVTALNEADEGTSPVAALLSEDALLKVDRGQVTATLRFNRGTIDGADTYGSYVTGIRTVAGATYDGTRLSYNGYDYSSTHKAMVNDISAPTSATITISGVSKTFRLQFDSPSAFSLGPADIPDGALRQAICALLGEDAGQYAIQKEDMEWLRGYLNLRGKGITDLTGLRHAVNVTHLDMSYSSLGGVENLNAMLGEIAQLPNLEQLNLSNNALTSLPAIGDMPNLAEINVGYNQLTDLPQFTNLPALTTFYGNDNNFQRVPESLFNLTSLVKLDLQNNAIAEISSSISALGNLETLYMTNNLLQTLPASFNGLSKLKTMAFMHNQLTSLPADLSGLTGVTTVSLGYNMLENIPEGLFTLPNVEDITADNNRVREVGGGIGDLNKLRKITLNNNQIEALPASMNNLTALTEINMSYNNLTTLPDDLSGLTNLETANFANNKLTALPDSVGDWTALKTLKLAANSLKTLPASMGGLTNLSDLDLGSNSFEALPGALASMPALKAIKMSYNKVAAAPADLSRMTAVTAIQLQNNRLGELPEGFKTLPNVQHMYLQNNFLETIPENYFDGLTALKTLNITKNFIQFSEGSTELSEIQKLRNRSVPVTVTGNAAPQGPFAALKSLESSAGELELKNDGALSYTLSAKAPAGTSSITLTPTGVKSDTTITMGDTTVNSGESLMAGGLATGVNSIVLMAASPIDGSQVTYQIQLTVGAGSSDGFPQDGHTYGITVTLLHASLDVPSMADNYIINDASIKVVGGQMHLYLTTDNADIMSDFRYRNAAGEYVAAELTSSDPAANLATYKMPVSTIDEPLHLQAYAAPMGYSPYFRLSFDRETLADITGEQEPEGLADGTYTIPVSLWHATSDMASMGNGGLEQTAKLVVENGEGTLHLTFKALTVAAMNMTGYLSQLDLLKNIVFNQYNYPESYDLIPATVVSTYDVVDAFNAPDSTDPNCAGKMYPKEITVPVVPGQEYTWVHVYVPVMGSMGVGNQVARIKLDYGNLVAPGEPNPNDEPVREITASAGVVTIGRGDIAGISVTRNIGLNFSDVNIVFPVQYLNNYFAGDASGTGSLQLQKNEASAGTRQSIISIMADTDTLVSAIELNLKIGDQSITDLGGSVKITISLTDEQVAALASAGSKKLCHYNPDTGALEDMGATFDLTNKTVTFYTDHFSTYAIISAPTGGSGTGGVPEDTGELSDGIYNIKFDALQQYSDDYSMAEQFFTQPAVLEVSGSIINVTIVMYGTTSSPEKDDGIHMRYINKLQYQNSSGNWINVTKTLNDADDTMTIAFTVSTIDEPVYMRVQTDYMGPDYKVFRLVFYKNSLERGGLVSSGAVSAATQYTIKAEAGEGGAISPSGDVSVKKNEDQTFTISANAGYKIKDVLVNGKSVGAVSTYTFKAVKKDGTISAVFEKTEEIPVAAEAAAALKFTDIAGHWAEKVIYFVVSKGMFNGTSETMFSPDAFITRGMFVTVLGRICQIDPAKYAASPFADVAPETYYAPYIAWAAANDLVRGVGNGMFEPDREITREEMAVIFVKFAKIAGIELPDASAPATAAVPKGALKDGRYTIDASALMENKDDASMADQFFTEPATLTVAGGKITATMVWHGTEYVTMDMLEELKVQQSGGELADVKRFLNQQENTLTITFEVEDIQEATVMQVYVPRGMGEIRPKFRLVFDNTSLKEQGALTFADAGEISAWARESVEKMNMAGIITGKEHNMFDPRGLATRAEAAVILARSAGFSD